MPNFNPAVRQRIEEITSRLLDYAFELEQLGFYKQYNHIALACTELDETLLSPPEADAAASSVESAA